MPNPWSYARDDDEHSHQVALFMWVAVAKIHGITAANDISSYDRPGWTGPKEPIPELKLLYAIPNGGQRDVRVAVKLKAEGVRAGVHDLFLPAAKCGYHGLYIEMKKPIGGRASTEQLEWRDLVFEQDYFAALCRSWEAAAQVLTAYLSGDSVGLNALHGWPEQ